MAVADRAETFVALRARHEAFVIATAVVRGGGVDVEQLNCHACGRDIDWRNANEQICVDCPNCGAVNELPCHLRYRVAPGADAGGILEYASVEGDRRQWWNDVLPVAHSVEPVVPVQPAPMWLNAFCLACLAAVLIC